MGESHRALGEAANRFFTAWIDMMTGLLDEAKASGILKPDADSRTLSHLVVASIEGALILYKASRSATELTRTSEALKMVLNGLRIEQARAD